MNKSQLRRLALQYAHGHVEREDYLARRRVLIEGIEAGRIAIERETAAGAGPEPNEPPQDTPGTPAEDSAEESDGDPPPQGPPSAARSAPSPLHLGIGAAVLLAVGVTVASLLGGEDPPPAPVVRVTPSPPPPPPPVPPARQLIEGFVAERDFSATGVARFKARWNALAPLEVQEARGTPWFRRLVTAVVQEVKTQKALADLDGSAGALDHARRLVEFGRQLGISEDLLPDMAAAAARPETPERTAAAGTAAVTAPSEETVVEPAPARTATPRPPSRAPDAGTTAPVAAHASPRGRAWLASQPAGTFTLQLFALDHLDRVESLVARHPELELQLIDYAPAEPRYRVLYGAYPSAEQAEAAHAGLPEDVRSAQPRAFVRRVEELERPADRPPPGAVPAAASRWLREQPRERFTLQLFASSNRDNAQRLIGRFPDLALALHESGDQRTPFRVLYGSYSSPEEARRAFEALPAPLAADAGMPLVKSIGELQDADTRLKN